MFQKVNTQRIISSKWLFCSGIFVSLILILQISANPISTHIYNNSESPDIQSQKMDEAMVELKYKTKKLDMKVVEQTTIISILSEVIKLNVEPRIFRYSLNYDDIFLLLDIEEYMEKSINIFNNYNEINKNELTLDNIKIIEEKTDDFISRILKE